MQNPPVQSLRTLLIASATAIVLAGLVLIVAVLPAEFGVDPTGLGSRLGLTAISDQGGTMVKPLISACRIENQEWQDTVTIVIPAQKGLEYKFALETGARLEFEWQTGGGEPLYYDLHGEPSGDTSGYFKSFKETTGRSDAGSIRTEFSGPHGWYWENRTRGPVTVILHTRGNYKVLGLMH